MILAFSVIAVSAEHRHSGRRRNNMLDLNRTPRRELSEDAENLFETVEGTGDTCDLRGNWYNQHGSELILNQTEDGKLSGEFRTAVRLTARSQNQERSFASVKGEIFGKIRTFWEFQI